jgi:hypothetical protein
LVSDHAHNALNGEWQYFLITVTKCIVAARYRKAGPVCSGGMKLLAFSVESTEYEGVWGVKGFSE